MSDDVKKQLLDYFDPEEVKWKPQVVSGNRALAIAYIDARVVQDRLDEAVGVDGWQDDYEVLADGSVVCRLGIKIGGEWLTKTDVGSLSEQPDDGDKLKAAFSDALKRAAVKFGVGRYLYRLPSQWVDYDAQKKRFTTPPTLPAWALPGAKPGAAKPAKAGKPPASMPADGKEFAKRLADKERELVLAGHCATGDLLRYLKDMGEGEGYPKTFMDWPFPEGPVEAAKWVNKFVAERRAQKAG